MRSAVQQYLQAERDSVNLAKLVQFVTLKVSIGYLFKVPEQDLSKKKDAIISIANRINDLWILSKGSGGDERSIPAWDEEQDIIQNLLTVIPDHNREISTGTRIGLSRMATSTMDDARWATVAPPAHLDSCCVGDVLDTSHQNVFATTMSNLLSTDIAEQTFAQIIDGLPLRDVAFSLRSPQYTRRDPVFAHTELCPGVLERTRMFRDSFSPREMELRTDVLQRYQDAPAGSRASKLPLLELVAVAVHTIAAELFGLDGALHKRDTPCTRYKGDASDAISRLSRLPPWPTVFGVCSYTDPAQYPRGVADVAGYWAEDIIFGGVVLFGRGESGIGYDGVWFESHRKGVTYRIYALTEEQIESLLHFLEWEPKSQPNQKGQRPECPLPILGNDTNLTRVDPDVAIPMHNVFRDRWEKKAYWKSYATYSWGAVKGRPRDELNYPEVKKRRVVNTRRTGGSSMTFGELRNRRKNGDESGSGSGT